MTGSYFMSSSPSMPGKNGRPNYLIPAVGSDKATGFEEKTLRVVIENWLYHSDIDVRIDAAKEVRKRLRKTFPCPPWLEEQ